MNTYNAAIAGSFLLMWISAALQASAVFLGCVVAIGVLMGLRTRRSGVMPPAVKFARLVASKLARQSRMRIRASSDDKMAKIATMFLKYRAVRLLEKKINLQIHEQIKASGRAYNPELAVRQSIGYFAVSLLILIPTSAALAVLIGSHMFLLLTIPAVLLFYPKIRLCLVISERKTSIDDELAYFALYASVMQSVGQSLYSSMVGMLDKGMFSAMEREATMLSRNVHLFGMDQMSALNEHGMLHPNRNLRNLLLGYVSVGNSGGDLGRYMEEKSREFFHKAKFKHASYRTQAQIIGESMLILLSVLPTMILVSSFLLAEESVRAVMYLSFVLVPVLAISIITIMGISQPKFRDFVGFDLRALPAGMLVFAAFFALGHPSWLAVGTGIAAGSLFNFASCLRQFREIANTESCISDFLRDVTEYRKIGIPIQNAIVKISEERHYNRYFDGLVGMVAARLRYGHNLDVVVNSISARSWVVRATFFILGKIASSGGGTARTLEQVTGFLAEMHSTKKETQAGVGVISYFALSSPVLMSYTSKEMARILEGLGLTGNSIHGVFNLKSLLVSSELMDAVGLLIVISATCLGLVMSKLTYFTLRHTLILGVSVLVSVLSVIFSPFLPSLVNI
jgi:archaeal flagellar protein FlaJ